MTKEQIQSEGYYNLREIDGKWYGLLRMIFTAGLCCDIDSVGYEKRFCYENELDAKKALEEYSGSGDPTGPWIKQKGRAGERRNPNI